MTERRTIGQILVELGRITEDDVARALEYQRDRGGFFGEALVASGVVSEEELEWGLASQHDLHYVFPDADAIDLEAAALVSAEWALANLTLPIVRTGNTVQVIIDSPLKDDALRELRERTGLEVDVALAGPAAIREVIGEVFSRLAAADEAGATPVDLASAMDEINRVRAPRFGISVRGARALAWWETSAGVRRRPLSGGWRVALDRMLAPGPSEAAGDRLRAEWSADINRDGDVTPVEVRYLSDESGRELAFERKQVDPELDERFGRAPAELAAEVAALAHGGGARISVRSSTGELARAITPHLPALLLGPHWRSVYLFAERGAEHEAFSVRLPDDPAAWPAEADALGAFRFDAAAIDLGGASGDAGPLRRVADTFFLLGGDGARDGLDVRWTLDIEHGTDGDLTWSLGPING
jgi:type IV pilus assembly protein PilB